MLGELFTMTTAKTHQDSQEQRNLSRRTFLKYAGIISAGAVISACSSEPAASVATPAASAVAGTAPKLGKVKIAYSGGACEAPTFIAYEKGFFAQEGLEPELLAVDFNT